MRQQPPRTTIDEKKQGQNNRGRQRGVEEVVCTAGNGSDDEIPQSERSPPKEAAIVFMALLAPLEASERKNYQGLIDRKDILAKALAEHKSKFGSLPTNDDWAWYEDIGGEISVR